PGSPAVGHALRVRRTPREEGAREVTPNGRPHSDAFVFFGASGDLVFKKIFPALYRLAARGKITMPLIGVARSPSTVEQFRERARKSLEEHGKVEPKVFDVLAKHLTYIQGDYGDPAMYAAIKKELGDAKHAAYYLAIPPSVFPTVIEGLGKSGCAAGARIIVEKPFGRDLPSAKALNVAIHSVF